MINKGCCIYDSIRLVIYTQFNREGVNYIDSMVKGYNLYCECRLEGVIDKNDDYKGVNDKDMLEGVSDKNDDYKGVSYKNDDYKGVMDKDSNIKGVNINTNTYHPLNNINTYPPLNNTKSSHPLNNTFSLTSSNTRYIEILQLSIKYNLPILLQGPTCTGKTALITYISKINNTPLIRINNHNNITRADYIGTYQLINNTCTFIYGPLLHCMLKGCYLLLDELNLAPSEVLEVLNRVLDCNREIYVDEIQQTVKCSKGFRVFCTQNVMYGGRKGLSEALRNRFVEVTVEQLTLEDIKSIVRGSIKGREGVGGVNDSSSNYKGVKDKHSNYKVVNKNSSDYKGVNDSNSNYKGVNDSSNYKGVNDSNCNYKGVGDSSSNYHPLNKCSNYHPLNKCSNYHPISNTTDTLHPLNNNNTIQHPLSTRIINKILSVYDSLRLYRNFNSLISIRDILRWVRRKGVSEEEVYENGVMLLFERQRNYMDRCVVKGVLDDVFRGVVRSRGVSNSTSNYHPVSNSSNNYHPLNINTNSHHPFSNSTNTYPPVNNSSNTLHPLNNSINNYHPVSNSTNTHHPFSNSTNTYHPVNNSSNNYHPVNNTNNNYHPFNNSSNTSFVLTPSYLRMYTLIYTAWINKEPILLIGETGIGKTKMLEYVSNLMGVNIETFSCNSNTQTHDFIGYYTLGKGSNEGGVNDSSRVEGVSNSSMLEGVNHEEYELEGVSNSSMLEGVSNKDYGLEGVNVKDFGLEGVNVKGSNYKGVNVKEYRLEGVNVKSPKQQGLSNSTNTLHPFSKIDRKQQGLSNSTNTLHPFSNIDSKQQGLSNSTNNLHPFSKIDRKQQGLSNSTNNLHPLNNSTNNYNPVSNSTNTLHPLNNNTNNNNTNTLFKYGPLVTAMRTGKAFLFDEINLTDDSVLERINSLLDDSNTLYIPETNETIYPNNNFILLATMNPGTDIGKKELSPALRSRFNEIYFDIPNNEIEGVMMDRVGYSVKGVSMRKVEIVSEFYNVVSVRDMLKGDSRVGVSDSNGGVSDKDSKLEGVSNKDSKLEGVNNKDSKLEGVSNTTNTYHPVSNTTNTYHLVNTNTNTYHPVNTPLQQYFNTLLLNLKGTITIYNTNTFYSIKEESLELIGFKSNKKPILYENNRVFGVLPFLIEKYEKEGCYDMLEGKDNSSNNNTPLNNCTSNNTPLNNCTSNTYNNTLLNNSTDDNTLLNNSISNNTLLNNSISNNTLLNNSTDDNTLLNNSTDDNTLLNNSISNNTYFSFDNLTTLYNLRRILKGMFIRKPILLKGIPGVGKTDILKNISYKLKIPFMRINMSEQTEVEELFGTYVLTDKKLKYKLSSLSISLNNKLPSIILLDEINLTPSSVIEGVNSLLDYRREISVEGFKICNYNSFIFCSCNYEGEGRKSMPRSFIDRFVVIDMESYTEEDISKIMGCYNTSDINYSRGYNEGVNDSSSVGVNDSSSVGVNDSSSNRCVDNTLLNNSTFNNTLLPSTNINNTLLPTTPSNNTLLPTTPSNNTLLPTTPSNNTLLPTTPSNNTLLPTTNNNTFLPTTNINNTLLPTTNINNTPITPSNNNTPPFNIMSLRTLYNLSLRDCLKIKLLNHNYFSINNPKYFIRNNTLYIGSAILPLNLYTNTYTLLHNQLNSLETIIHCYNRRIPVILLGCSRYSVIRFISYVSKHKVSYIYCYKGTDTNDLLGTYGFSKLEGDNHSDYMGVNESIGKVEGDNEKDSDYKGDNEKDIYYKGVNKSTSNYHPVSNTTDKQHPFNNTTDKQHPFNKSISNYHPVSNTTHKQHPFGDTTHKQHPFNNTTNKQHPFNNNPNSTSFTWSDSSLVTSIINGNITVINRVDLVDKGIFDRLCSLFEFNRSLYITERGFININKDTWLVSIVDDLKGVSTAMKDRCVIVELKGVTDCIDVWKMHSSVKSSNKGGDRGYVRDKGVLNISDRNNTPLDIDSNKNNTPLDIDSNDNTPLDIDSNKNNTPLINYSSSHFYNTPLTTHCIDNTPLPLTLPLYDVPFPHILDLLSNNTSYINTPLWFNNTLIEEEIKGYSFPYKVKGFNYNNIGNIPLLTVELYKILYYIPIGVNDIEKLDILINNRGSDNDMLGSDMLDSGLEGVNNKNMIEGVSNNTSNYHPFSNGTSKQQGVNNSIDDYHPFSNSNSKQQGVNNTIDDYHPFSNNLYTHNPVNDITLFKRSVIFLSNSVLSVCKGYSVIELKINFIKKFIGCSVKEYKKLKDIYNKLKGVENFKMYKCSSVDIIGGDIGRDILGGVNNSTNEQQGVNNSGNTYHPVNDSTNTYHPFSNSNNTQHPFNKNTNTQHPFNNTPYTQHPFNNNTNTYHPFNNSTNTYHPFNHTPTLLHTTNTIPSCLTFIINIILTYNIDPLNIIRNNLINKYNDMINKYKNILYNEFIKGYKYGESNEYTFYCKEFIVIYKEYIKRIEDIENKIESRNIKGVIEEYKRVRGVSDKDKYRGVSDKDRGVSDKYRGVSAGTYNYNPVNNLSNKQQGVTDTTNNYNPVNSYTCKQQGVYNLSIKQQGVNNTTMNYNPVNLNTSKQQGVNNTTMNYNPVNLNTSKQQGVSNLFNKQQGVTDTTNNYNPVNLNTSKQQGVNNSTMNYNPVNNFNIIDFSDWLDSYYTGLFNDIVLLGMLFKKEVLIEVNDIHRLLDYCYISSKVKGVSDKDMDRGVSDMDKGLNVTTDVQQGVNNCTNEQHSLDISTTKQHPFNNTNIDIKSLIDTLIFNTPYSYTTNVISKAIYLLYYNRGVNIEEIVLECIKGDKYIEVCDKGCNRYSKGRCVDNTPLSNSNIYNNNTGTTGTENNTSISNNNTPFSNSNIYNNNTGTTGTENNTSISNNNTPFSNSTIIPYICCSSLTDMYFTYIDSLMLFVYKNINNKALLLDKCYGDSVSDCSVNISEIEIRNIIRNKGGVNYKDILEGVNDKDILEGVNYKDLIESIKSVNDMDILEGVKGVNYKDILEGVNTSTYKQDPFNNRTHKQDPFNNITDKQHPVNDTPYNYHPLNNSTTQHPHNNTLPFFNLLSLCLDLNVKRKYKEFVWLVYKKYSIQELEGWLIRGSIGDFIDRLLFIEELVINYKGSSVIYNISLQYLSFNVVEEVIRRIKKGEKGIEVLKGVIYKGMVKGYRDSKLEGVSYMDSKSEGVSYMDSKSEGVSYMDSKSEGVSYKDSNYKGVSNKDSNYKAFSNKDSNYKGFNNSIDIEEGVNNTPYIQHPVSNSSNNYHPFNNNTYEQDPVYNSIDIEEGVNNSTDNYHPVNKTPYNYHPVNDSTILNSTLNTPIISILKIVDNLFTFYDKPVISMLKRNKSKNKITCVCKEGVIINKWVKDLLNTLSINKGVCDCYRWKGVIKGMSCNSKKIKEVLIEELKGYRIEGVNNSIDNYHPVNNSIDDYKGVNNSTNTLHPVNNSTNNYHPLNIPFIFYNRNIPLNPYSKEERVLGSIITYYTEIEGVSNKDIIEGVSNSIDVYNPVSYNTNTLHPVNNKSNEQQGVSNNTNTLHPVSNSTNTLHPVNNKSNEQQGVSNSTNTLHPANNKSNEQQGVSYNTNTLHPVSNSTNTLHPVNNILIYSSLINNTYLPYLLFVLEYLWIVNNECEITDCNEEYVKGIDRSKGGVNEEGSEDSVSEEDEEGVSDEGSEEGVSNGTNSIDEEEGVGDEGSEEGVSNSTNSIHGEEGVSDKGDGKGEEEGVNDKGDAKGEEEGVSDSNCEEYDEEGVSDSTYDEEGVSDSTIIQEGVSNTSNDEGVNEEGVSNILQEGVSDCSLIDYEVGVNESNNEQTALTGDNYTTIVEEGVNNTELPLTGDNSLELQQGVNEQLDIEEEPLTGDNCNMEGGVNQQTETTDTLDLLSNTMHNNTPLNNSNDSPRENTPLNNSKDSLCNNTPLNNHKDSPRNNTPLTNGKDSPRNNTPLTNGKDSLVDNTPLNNSKDSPRNNTPLTNGKDSISDNTPLNNCKDSIHDNTPLTNNTINNTNNTPLTNNTNITPLFSSLDTDTLISRLLLTLNDTGGMRYNNGCYRSGRKLSIKKVVEYIASGYKRDRIFMRRNKKGGGICKICIFIDNSKSMKDYKEVVFNLLNILINIINNIGCNIEMYRFGNEVISITGKSDMTFTDTVSDICIGDMGDIIDDSVVLVITDGIFRCDEIYENVLCLLIDRVGLRDMDRVSVVGDEVKVVKFLDEFKMKYCVVGEDNFVEGFVEGVREIVRVMRERWE
ncbi:hypothetical protein LUQ84_000462 [Hamiltosporidium tvaerminnensis]|nr:hypothetical protein LUQ84_000462 [Hamiltosporidium tvaerminnensis]